MAIRTAVSLGSCIAGIPITLHYSFFLLLLVEFLYSLQYTRTTPPYPKFVLFVAVLYGPVLLLTILVHEFGHALVAKRKGATVGGVVLWPLGGFAICGPTDSLAGDLIVALAGPATHVPMAALWWLVYLAAGGGGEAGLWPTFTIYLEVLSSGAAGFFRTLASQSVYFNLVLLFFNLFIPAYPLDGGRIFAASLMLVFKCKGQSAAKITALTAMLIASAMVIYALIGMFRGHGGELLLALIGAFIFFQSWELFRFAQQNNLGNHPIFGRECYRGGSGGGGGNDRGSGGNNAAATAGDDEGTVATEADENVIV